MYAQISDSISGYERVDFSFVNTPDAFRNLYRNRISVGKSAPDNVSNARCDKIGIYVRRRYGAFSLIIDTWHYDPDPQGRLLPLEATHCLAGMGLRSCVKKRNDDGVDFCEA